MEIFLSAVLGELTTRSINFFISKTSKPTPLDLEDRLHRVLIRAQIIVDEAARRQITNQAMLLQLVMLRDAMHRGCYALDAFRCQSAYDEDSKDHHGVSHSLPLSKLNSLKGLYSSSENTKILEQVQEALDRLNSMIADVHELVMFLTNYPHMYRQPYSMHLHLANCMFGRQTEVQLVINFLLDTQLHGAEELLEVLPIVGPSYVGKSTLVAHACKDDRVCDHFSEILYLRNNSFTEDELAEFTEGCARRSRAPNSEKDGRFLVIVELDGDLDEDSWNRLYTASKLCMPSGSKIIVTSRSDKIARFGTTWALTLKYLSHEAYWYFFKTLTFGSTDPEMHPRLMHIAMEIASTQRRSFLRANITACVLRNNFDLQFWCKVLAFLRGPLQKYASRLGDEHPFELLNQNRPVRVGRMDSTSEDLVIYHQYRRPAEEEVPKITMQDVGFGSMKPHGKVEVLGWKSRIPPYYSYICSCEIRELKTKAAKRKRSMEVAIGGG